MDVYCYYYSVFLLLLCVSFTILSERCCGRVCCSTSVLLSWSLCEMIGEGRVEEYEGEQLQLLNTHFCATELLSQFIT